MPDPPVTLTPAAPIGAEASTTRRQFLAMLGAAGLLAACGDDGGNESTSAPATRTVRADGGTVEVPAEPQRVVAAIGSFGTASGPSPPSRPGVSTSSTPPCGRGSATCGLAPS